jgi:hypothetical protein
LLLLLLLIMILILPSRLMGPAPALFSHFKNAKKFQPNSSNSIKGKVGILKYFSRD